MMNHIQKRRLIGMLSIIVILMIALTLILFALKQNINLFYTPTQLLQATVHPEQIVRIGGYVKPKSIHYAPSGEGVDFIITDHTNDLAVSFQGVLPSLFRENQGVVVTGKLNGPHALRASEVLAKHDEKYMPLKIPGDQHAT